MIAQTGDLTVERGGGHSLLIAFPIVPALPGVAAGPTGHDENAQPIRLLKEFIAIEMAFKANGIQAHVTNIGKVSVQSSGGPSKKHVLVPSGAANEHFPAIDLEEAMAFGREFRSNFANAKGDLCPIRNALAAFKVERCSVESRRAHLIGPPELRMLQLEFWELRRREFYNPGFSASQLHVLLQFKPLQLRVQDPFYRSGRGILQFGADRELGSLVSRPQPGSHKWVSQCNFSALRQKYFPPDTHHFVGGSGIPIHPSDLEVVSLRREDFHGDGVTLACLNELADIEYKGSVGAGNLGFAPSRLTGPGLSRRDRPSERVGGAWLS